MFNEIMKEIKAGLTGDPKHDIPYLDKQCSKYRNHEFNLEIVRACSRMIAEMLPEDEKEKFRKAVDKQKEKMNNLLKDARSNAKNRKFLKAEEQYRSFMRKLEDLNMFKDDRESIYFSFEEPFEEILYAFYYQPKRTIRAASFGYSSLYLEYGGLLFEMKRYDEAQKVLEKAMKWNPVNTAIRFEYAEIFKVWKDMEKFFELSCAALEYAFRPEAVARCYRNIGYYFIEKKLYREAIVCYHLSLNYAESEVAFEELGYIEDKSGINSSEVSLEDSEEISATYGFPMLVNEEIIELMYNIGMKAYEGKNYSMASYLLGLFYNLTSDKKVERLLKKMSKIMMDELEEDLDETE